MVEFLIARYYGLGSARFAAQRARGVLDRLDHFRVAGAAAQVAGKRIADLLHAGVGYFIEQRLGRQDHAGPAEAALQRRMLLERLLQRMQFIPGREPLDGQHLAAVGLTGQHQAGVDRLAVHEHGARAAIADVAAELGAGQVELIAQEPEQRRFRRAPRPCASRR